MAAVTSLGNIINTGTGTHTVTATPAVSDLICICAVNTGITADPTVTDDNSDGLGTYTKSLQVDYTDGTPTASRIFLYTRDALVGSATSTIFSVTGASSTGGGVVVLKVTGMTRVSGTGAILQTASEANRTAGTTPAPAFGVAAQTGNPTIGFMVHAQNSLATEPSGWTERADAGYGSPNTGVHVVTRDSGFTGTTVTWGAAVGGNISDLIAELDTSSVSVGAKRLAALGVG